MRICFVAPANNYHTKKWANWFLGRGHEIHVVSFIKDEIPGVTVHYIDTGTGPESGDASKLKYLLHAKDLRRIVDSIEPDIVNVHYATSYGTVAALSGIKPYVLSVWGSDIYDFPKKSPLHKAMLKYSLKKATWLFSTSKAMAQEGSKYTNKKFEITPFGVDMKLFNPDKRTRPRHVPPFTIGTVKTMADLYGIEYILKAVAIIVHENDNINVVARISGDGPELEKYRKLAVDLGISDRIHFLGRISQERAAEEWANMDVAVIPSILYESFGVSAVEAQATETPVIISDVEGLKEATLPNKSSLIVQKKNEREIAETILDLYRNPGLCCELGTNGRKYVVENYELNSSFSHIETLLETMWGGY